MQAVRGATSIWPSGGGVIAFPRYYRGLWALGGFVAATLGVSVVAGAVTAPAVGDGYAALAETAILAEGWLMAPLAAALYLVMAVSAWLVWREGPSREVNRALGLYFVQLALNLAWPLLFFLLHQRALALVTGSAWLAAALVTWWAFRSESRPAGKLVLPSVAWAALAVALNLQVWLTI